jgi:hypothetical protein
MKSRRICCAGHVGRMEKRRMHIGYFWGSQKERDHQVDLDIDGSILKWNIQK